jgi:predicted DNA-binding WGR domain protein
MIRLEYIGWTDLGNPSRKYWEADIEGRVFRSRHGRIGTEGTLTEPKVFPSRYSARRHLQAMTNQKERKGYVGGEISGSLFPDEGVRKRQLGIRKEPQNTVQDVVEEKAASPPPVPETPEVVDTSQDDDFEDCEIIERFTMLEFD